jgi:hypothetical protein
LKVFNRQHACITGRTIVEIFDCKWERENETIEEFLENVRYRFPNQEVRIVPGGAEVVIVKKVEPTKNELKKDDKLKDYKSPGYREQEAEEDIDVYEKYADYDPEDDYATKRKKRGKK